MSGESATNTPVPVSETDYITFFVVYRTGAWSRGCVETHRRQFPHERLLVIDNNDPGYVEGGLLAREHNVTLVRGNGSRHGDGMDTALSWCRQNDVSIMVHVEPDMIFLGRQWKLDLVAGIRDGYEMVGTHQKGYGPVHPAASAWDTSARWSSFNSGRKTWRERLSPDYRRLVHMRDQPEWFHRNWDTAQRNWYQAARGDKVLMLDESKIHGPQLVHFWYGSQTNPDSRYVEVLQRARGL